MRVKSTRLVFAAALSLTLLAACSGSSATTAPSTAPAESTAPTQSAAPAESMAAQPSAGALKVALILPGPASDKGFNQSAYEALAELQSKYGAETAYTESVAPNEYSVPTKFTSPGRITRIGATPAKRTSASVGVLKRGCSRRKRSGSCRYVAIE